MEYKHRIYEIERRAKLIREPLRDLCAVAKVNISTFYRWRQDDANPRFRDMSDALDAMEAALAERERKLVELLTGAA